MKKTYIVILKNKTGSELTTTVKSWNMWTAGIKAVVLNYDLGFTTKDIAGVVDNNVL